jgi:hypothetical protein
LNWLYPALVESHAQSAYDHSEDNREVGLGEHDCHVAETTAKPKGMMHANARVCCPGFFVRNPERGYEPKLLRVKTQSGG